MKRHLVYDRFDYSAFIDDVNRYLRRHDLIGWRTLGRLIGCADHAAKSVLTKQSEPSLFMVLTLADLADLSVDKYRLVPGQEIEGTLENI